MTERVMMENERGEWVPAIPIPLWLGFGRAGCGCGRTFRGRQRYEEHYAYEHIVMGRPEHGRAPRQGDPRF